jgi:hypothetical protein
VHLIGGATKVVSLSGPSQFHHLHWHSVVCDQMELPCIVPLWNQAKPIKYGKGTNMQSLVCSLAMYSEMTRGHKVVEGMLGVTDQGRGGGQSSCRCMMQTFTLCWLVG